MDQSVPRRVFLGPCAVEVDDRGVDISKVDDFGLLVSVLVKHGVCTDEDKYAYPHD